MISNSASFNKQLLRCRKVCLDSSCFIYKLEAHKDYFDITNLIFTYIEKGRIKGLTTTISVVETFVKPERLRRFDFIKKCEYLLKNFPNLEFFPVTFDLARKAAKIRANTSFKTPDAIQLALAVQEKTDAFITNDQRLKSFKEVKVLVLKDFVK